MGGGRLGCGCRCRPPMVTGSPGPRCQPRQASAPGVGVRVGSGSWSEKRCSARYWAENGRDVSDNNDRDVTFDSTPHHYHSPVAPGAETGPGTERPASDRGRPRPEPTADARTSPRPAPSLRVRPKPKRRTEFVLLLFGSGIVVALYIITSLGQNSKIPADISPFLGIVLGLALGRAHGEPLARPRLQRGRAAGGRAVQRHRLRGHREMGPRAPLHGEARNQALWTAIGVGAYVLTLLVVRHSRDLERYRYLLLLLAGILLVLPLGFSRRSTAPGCGCISAASASSRSSCPRSCSASSSLRISQRTRSC